MTACRHQMRIYCTLAGYLYQMWRYCRRRIELVVTRLRGCVGTGARKFYKHPWSPWDAHVTPGY
jgi:hypothetical protein